MEAVSNEQGKCKQELASLVDYTGTMDFGGADGYQVSELDPEKDNMRDTVKEFAKGVGEMSVDLAKSFGDIVKQSLGGEDSFVKRKLGKPCDRVFGRLRFLNKYLPEDRDPLHSLTVIFLVFFVALSALSVRTAPDENIPALKEVFVHPPSASHISLPDGRHIAYREQGLPPTRARIYIFIPHSFLSSRLAGVPGLKDELLEEFGLHLIMYDLPGFGESDPHPQRTLESSAMDIAHLADSLEVHDKFWMVGHSAGSIHVWAALKYIPDRLAGVAMFAPMVNPYDPSMRKEERSRVWDKWTPKRKLVYVLARRLPGLLAFFYHRSFFSGKHAPADKWLSLSLGKRDRALIEDSKFEEFWQRNVEESIRQGNVKPFVEEAVLQVSNWGFKISELQAQKENRKNDLFHWFKSMYRQEEGELTGFLGPIHIWQGMDDRVVPPAVTSFLHRNLPGATIHILPDEGHFTYLYFCDDCHRQIFTTIFGTPLGPLQAVPPDPDELLLKEQATQQPQKRPPVADSTEEA